MRLMPVDVHVEDSRAYIMLRAANPPQPSITLSRPRRSPETGKIYPVEETRPGGVWVPLSGWEYLAQAVVNPNMNLEDSLENIPSSPGLENAVCQTVAALKAVCVIVE